VLFPNHRKEPNFSYRLVLQVPGFNPTLSAISAHKAHAKITSTLAR
jgi:hypothetical protein